MKALPYAMTGLLFGGCSLVGPEPPEIDVSPPPGWSGAADAGPVSGAWWQSFGDSELAALVDEALANNRNLRALAERMGAAAAQARIAGADGWPQLSGRGNGRREKQVFVGFPIPGAGGAPLSRTFTSYGVSLDLSWEVDLWGRLRSRSDAAQADLTATALDYAGARESLAGQVAKAQFALAEARQQAELAQQTVTSYRNTLAIVENRFRTGARPELDIRLTRSALLRSELDLEQRRHFLDSAKRQLELLAGRYPDARVAAAALPQLPPAPPAGIPAQLLDRRPDLRAHRVRLLAAHHRVGEAKGALYPRISLTGSTGTVGNELENLLDGDFHVWSILGNLVQPIFQGGRLRAAVDAAEASRRESTSRFADAVLRAFFEVEGALAAAAYLKRQVDAARKLVAETEASTRIARDRYRQGRGGLLEMLESQRSNVNANIRLLAARRQQLDARIDLHLALGGSFTADPTERGRD